MDERAELAFGGGFHFLLHIGVERDFFDGQIRQEDLRIHCFFIDLGSVVHIVLGGEIHDLQGHFRLHIQIADALDGDVKLIRTLFADRISRLGDEEPVASVREPLRHGEFDMLRGVDRLVDFLCGVDDADLADLKQHEEGQEQ